MMAEHKVFQTAGVKNVPFCTLEVIMIVPFNKLNGKKAKNTSWHCLTWRQTIEKRIPQAMSTRNRKRTMATPPSCPNRLRTTKVVAKNHPQPHEMSMYSRCSVHWTHIRRPSSKKVETRQKRAKWGRMCFVCRVIWKSGMTEDKL